MQLDPRYVELAKEHPDNGCGHDLGQKEKFPRTQYFCYECKKSFCGECVYLSKVKNKNALKSG